MKKKTKISEKLVLAMATTAGAMVCIRAMQLIGGGIAVGEGYGRGQGEENDLRS